VLAVPVVVCCPKCEKRLAVKDELKGRALVCPQCKSRFSVPADDAPSDGVLGVAEEPRATGGSMDFLQNLGPSSVGAGKSASPSFAAADSTPWPTNGRAVGSSGAAARAAGRAKKRTDQMKLFYIGGGIAAAVVIGLIVAAVAISGTGAGGGSKKKDENIRFNLTETQRRQLFSDMFHAVDVNGPTKTCRDVWRRLGGELKLDDSQVSAVLKEGLDNGWEQPALEVKQDQKQKTNRRDWIRVMNESGHDPIMSL
jgi:hypothetical protein